MAALSVFVDLHNINLLLYKSQTEVWFQNFPYVYTSGLFSASYSEDEFYLEVFDNFCAEHGVNLDDCDVLLTGFLEPPKLGGDPRAEFSKRVHVKLAKSLYEVLCTIENYQPVLVTNHSVLTPTACFAIASVRSINKPSELLDVEEENYYADLDLYPQIVANDLTTQIDIDTNIAALLPRDFQLATDVPTVFCGSRFAHRSLFGELDHLLMLNFFKQPGIYDVYLDRNNALILTALLKMHEPELAFTPELLHEETVITSDSTIESVVQTQEGTSQLVHIDKNRLLVIPSAKGESLSIKLKSRDLGELERSLEGGNLGLIFDTRDTKSISAQDIKNFSLGLKNFRTSTH